MSDLCSDPEMICPYAEQPGSEKDTGVREVDVYGMTSRWTYDLIGQITIDHNFDSLGDWEGEGGKVYRGYERMQQMVPGTGGIRGELGLLWPWIDKVMVGPLGSEWTEIVAHRELEARSGGYGATGAAVKEGDPRQEEGDHRGDNG
jgi:hypothetical protein